jgi:hypothetical protein
MSVFKKATKSQSKLRLAIFGPSGGGKTYTSLKIATGICSVIGGRIAVIDTERGSASKYSDLFDFDVVEIGENPTIDNYVKMVTLANREGYSVIVIDSLSHGWQDLLTEVESLAKAKYKGNTWSAWSEGTPKQKMLIDSILNSTHIICTMRSKTEWHTEKDSNGRSKPVRVGLAPEQGKSIEYEFDMLMEVNPEHYVEFIKDRSGMYQDKGFNKPDESLGVELIKWLSTGDSLYIAKEEQVAISFAMEQVGIDVPQFLAYIGVKNVETILKSKYDDAMKLIQRKADAKAKEGEK